MRTPAGAIRIPIETVWYYGLPRRFAPRNDIINLRCRNDSRLLGLGCFMRRGQAPALQAASGFGKKARE